MSYQSRKEEALGRIRSYSSPRLVCYGSVRNLTNAGTGLSSESAAADCNVTDRKVNVNCSASDRNIKERLDCIGIHPLGLGLYLFDYKSGYREQWGFGRQFGVMADEVEAVMPQAVVIHPDGYKMVDYAMLGISRNLH